MTRKAESIAVLAEIPADYDRREVGERGLQFAIADYYNAWECLRRLRENRLTLKPCGDWVAHSRLPYVL